MTETKKTEHIADNIILIRDETHFLYIVTGAKNFLIDSSITAKAKKFHQSITTALKGEKIDTLLLTHSHYDHVGGASFLQGLYNFDVIASSEAVELLENPDMIEMIDYQNFLKQDESGPEPVLRNKRLKNLTGVSEGHKIEVSPGSYFEVIAAPGHSPCSIAYLLHPDRILFPGDSAGMMEENGKKRPVFFSGYNSYLETLQKLAALEPAGLAFSHAPYIEGKEKVQEYFNSSIEAAGMLKEKIVSQLKIGKQWPDIATAIATEEYTPGSVMESYDSYILFLRTMINILSRGGLS